MSQTTVSPSDRAQLTALKLWAGPEEPALLLRLGHQRARELRELRKSLPSSDSFATLQAAHQAQMLPDLGRVHHTWLIRALQDESPSVQRVVASSQTEPLRSQLIKAFNLAPDSLPLDHPAVPFAREAVLSLWTERLLGDAPATEDDPLIVQAITSHGERTLYRLARLTGLAKLSKIKQLTTQGFHPRTLDRLQWMNAHLAEPPDERLLRLAQRDWQEASAAKHLAFATLGLTTWARLLVHIDDYRLRWVLQHLPYGIVKRVRKLGSEPQARVRSVIIWEEQILATACERLAFETGATS